MFKVLISFLLLGVVSFAAPTRCDVSSASIDLPPGSPLTQPTHPVSFIGLGVGTQNYTCSDDGVFTNVGALAELFDVSCNFGTRSFDGLAIEAFAFWRSAPASVTNPRQLAFFRNANVLGEHFFVVNPVTGTGLSPKWDFTSEAFKGNPDAFVVGARVASMSSPLGSSSIDWLQLEGIAGSLADEVYRTDTVGGQPPASCVPGSPPIQVKYTSLYWLAGGSIRY